MSRRFHTSPIGEHLVSIQTSNGRTVDVILDIGYYTESQLADESSDWRVIKAMDIETGETVYLDDDDEQRAFEKVIEELTV